MKISNNYIKGLLFLSANLLVVFVLMVIVNPTYLPNLPFINQSTEQGTIVRTEAVQAEDPSHQISFIVFGDSGTGQPIQITLAKLMLKYPFDLMLHAGDVAYPSGTKQQLQENFFNVYQTHLIKASSYPSPGNHDYLTQNLEPYLDLFTLPQQAFNQNDQERYYSFDLWNAHFVSLDTNLPLDQVSETRSDDMADWLDWDLRNSTHSEWKIIYFHHAPYTSGNVHGGDQRVKRLIVPILEAYDVDLVFSGHEHNYERTCAILNDQCIADGITYVVTGGGGARLYDFGDLQYFTTTRAKQYHFVHVIIDDCQLKTNVIGIDNNLLDSFVMNKCEG